MYTFEYPYMALLLLLFLLCQKFCAQRSSALRFPALRYFASVAKEQNIWLQLLKYSAIVLVIIAAMSPIEDKDVTVEPNEGYDIALILDASRSMSETGFNPYNPRQNRFDVVKSIVGDFINKRPHDNLSLIVFGDYAFTAAPLTFDHRILSQIVSQLYLGMAGKSTALYAALAQGAHLLDASKAKSKIAILLTDGINTANSEVSLETALKLAKHENMRVYTIGIGADNSFNAQLLQYIAQQSGGKFFQARNAQQLGQIYNAIDSLEKSEIKTQKYSYKRYLFIYPLFFGLLMWLLFIYYKNKGVLA